MSDHVLKHILPNGLTVLVKEMHRVPKVSTQMWYRVGSKHERSGYRGLAHLLEHMIFKGTTRLTESDINTATQRMSGYTNAFTSHDFTGYLFDFPTAHWPLAYDLLSDCMSNCTFMEDLLQSELKAVIQELKMYKDDYESTLVEELISQIFTAHPYHYPIIGYKQDLCEVTREKLLKFYHAYYRPNNAALIVVGDVRAQEAIEWAHTYFGEIPTAQIPSELPYAYRYDIAGSNIVLHRQVEQPLLLCSWVVPGSNKRMDYALALLSIVLGQGRSSRLYARIVEEEQLATDASCYVYDTMEYSLLIVQVRPYKISEKKRIIDMVNEEIERLKRDGWQESEIVRARALCAVEHLIALEQYQNHAFALGKSYLAHNDENYVYTYLDQTLESATREMRMLLSTYFYASSMHTGSVEPIAQSELVFWQQAQEEIDALDACILNKKVRNTSIHEPRYALTVQPHKPVIQKIPDYTIETLKNGIDIGIFTVPESGRVELYFEGPASSLYDPVGKEGLAAVCYELLLEGTKKLSARELADAFESRGISIGIRPGFISVSCLARDVDYALSLMHQMLVDREPTKKRLEIVRQRLLADQADFWDSPSDNIKQIARAALYGKHQYGRHILGTPQSLQSITLDDVISWSDVHITPHELRIACAGDITQKNLVFLVQKYFGEWRGPEVPDIDFSPLVQATARTVTHAMNRDQIAIAWIGLSVKRMDRDYDALLLFEQIFAGGVLGSMNSLLFALREQSGLFYTIGASLVSGAQEEPGAVYIQTLVSPDKLAFAEKAIEEVIDTALDEITEERLENARDALIYSLSDSFETLSSITEMILFLMRYNLSMDYVRGRERDLANITADNVRKAVHNVLRPEHLIKVRVGRC